MVDECSICLSDLTSDTITTPCKHVFHEECLSSLIVKKCPLCREKLTYYVDSIKTMNFPYTVGENPIDYRFTPINPNWELMLLSSNELINRVENPNLERFSNNPIEYIPTPPTPPRLRFPYRLEKIVISDLLDENYYIPISYNHKGVCAEYKKNHIPQKYNKIHSSKQRGKLYHRGHFKQTYR